jgi:hypothetical protein
MSVPPWAKIASLISERYREDERAERIDEREYEAALEGDLRRDAISGDREEHEREHGEGPQAQADNGSE